MKTAEQIEPLTSKARSVQSLMESEIQSMWTLYAQYYGGTRESLFRADLAAKTNVILSRDSRGSIRGFSTIQICQTEFQGRDIAVIFSGDTMIDHRYWARNDFAFAWIRFAASVKSRAPETPLYWFLIVKGHRTYRYMSVFGRRYYPAPGWETPAHIQDLMDHLAGARFGEAYDRDSGLVCFGESRGHLKQEWARVPERARRRPEVAFFLDRNPGFAKGHELVCLCEVSEKNMKRITLRVFREVLPKPEPVTGT